ncbi:polygalacturonase ADPG2-like [Zingiber officinale]|uniref:polygalacturonase ADPG2-like n=1 Tax=Zingiber officinale TaxID=94328 RepID=UPI001C4B643E|nr:polygalacturonase ADPG2-like [Zingiber officinale]
MARRGLISLFVIFLLAAEILADEPTYNVVNFGAKGDGNTDDTQAFVNAWSSICRNSTGPSTLLIPAGNTFLLDRIVFQGPCNYVVHVKQCSMEAANSLRLMSCTNVQISGLKLINSPMMHISVGKSANVDIRGITISSPGDSPNTDGIHIQQSQHVMVTDSVIGTGDDCVSMSDGAVDVSVNNVACGPGHGISIGSLGIAGTVATASDIYVSNCNLSQTTNGVRIKTWQGGSGFARNISFVNINMNEVRNPIIIDQYYCPHSSCASKTTAVQVSDVKYLSVTGTSTSSVAIALNCSQTVPCTGITMDNVNLWSANQGQQVQSNCIDAKGSQYELLEGLVNIEVYSHSYVERLLGEPSLAHLLMVDACALEDTSTSPFFSCLSPLLKKTPRCALPRGRRPRLQKTPQPALPRLDKALTGCVLGQTELGSNCQNQPQNIQLDLVSSSSHWSQDVK